MYNNQENYNLENLPYPLLEYILSFIDSQERFETAIILRQVNKKLRQKLGEDEFLKNNLPFFYSKKFPKLFHFFDTEKIIDDQIKEWDKVKIKINEAFNPIYLSLQETKEIQSLIADIKNSSLPKHLVLRTLLRHRYFPTVAACLTVLVIISISVTSSVLPGLQSMQAQQNEIEETLTQEGCIIQFNNHKTEFLNCNDTSNQNVWERLDHEIKNRELYPIIMDTISGFTLLLCLVLFFVNYRRLQNTLPQSYTELPFNDLTQDQRHRLTKIRNDLNLTHHHFSKINDVVTHLEDVLIRKKISNSSSPQVITFRKEYLSLKNTLKFEIKKLNEYKAQKKSILSNKLSNGKLKTAFRTRCNQFFSDCHAFIKQQDNIETKMEDTVTFLELEVEDSEPLLSNHR